MRVPTPTSTHILRSRTPQFTNRQLITLAAQTGMHFKPLFSLSVSSDFFFSCVLRARNQSPIILVCVFSVGAESFKWHVFRHAWEERWCPAELVPVSWPGRKPGNETCYFVLVRYSEGDLSHRKQLIFHDSHHWFLGEMTVWDTSAEIP